jgi:hypothetical protein
MGVFIGLGDFLRDRLRPLGQAVLGSTQPGERADWREIGA